MTATEAYYAHLSACVICQKQQAPTGSGRCLYGFRSFLSFSAEVWKQLKRAQAAMEFAKGDLVEHAGTPGIILEIVEILNDLTHEPQAVVKFWGATKLDVHTQEILDTHICAPGKPDTLKAFCSKLHHANAMEVIAIAATQ